jgi:hypothetical protein
MAKKEKPLAGWFYIGDDKLPTGPYGERDSAVNMGRRYVSAATFQVYKIGKTGKKTNAETVKKEESQ